MPAIYNPKKPLISIHIPKTGGSTVKESLTSWYGTNFFTHYVNENELQAPPQHTLMGSQCIHGHFNRFRTFGVDDFYPQAEQFITFLRDPFQQHISTFFYIQREAELYKFNGLPTPIMAMKSFEEFLIYLIENRVEIQKGFANTMFAHLPARFLPFDARLLHSDVFIHIGITEKLTLSMSLLAKKLGHTYTEITPQNTSPRELLIHDKNLAIHKELFPIEHSFYNEIKELHLDELAQSRLI